MKLLLMETQETERLFLKSLFEGAGFAVDDVQSWTTFVARISAEGYDGVVANLAAPDTQDADGLRFLEAGLEKAPQPPRLKVAAYTYTATKPLMDETYGIFKSVGVVGSVYNMADLFRLGTDSVYDTLYKIAQDFGADRERRVFSAEEHPRPFPVRGLPYEPERALDARRVFIIHGRNVACVDQLVRFLASLDLRAVTWDGLTNTARDGTPTLEDNFLRGIKESQAILVALTGDEDVRLRERFREDGDDEAGVQPRPNVLYEAGIAIALRPRATIMLAFGEVRPFSDAAGRYIMKFTGSEKDRQNLASRLRNCGCLTTTEDPRYLTDGTFDCCLPDA